MANWFRYFPSPLELFPLKCALGSLSPIRPLKLEAKFQHQCKKGYSTFASFKGNELIPDKNSISANFEEDGIILPFAPRRMPLGSFHAKVGQKN